MKLLKIKNSFLSNVWLKNIGNVMGKIENGFSLVMKAPYFVHKTKTLG